MCCSVFLCSVKLMCCRVKKRGVYGDNLYVRGLINRFWKMSACYGHYLCVVGSILQAASQYYKECQCTAGISVLSTVSMCYQASLDVGEGKNGFSGQSVDCEDSLGCGALLCVAGQTWVARQVKDGVSGFVERGRCCRVGLDVWW